MVAGRAHHGAANREAELLEAAGAQGSAVVIVYHGVVNSELSEIMPSRILREHLQILKKAGFRFITARDLPKYLAGRQFSGRTTPNLAAVITPAALILRIAGRLVTSPRRSFGAIPAAAS